VRHGDIHPRPDVAALEGDAVRFADGTRERVDVLDVRGPRRLEALDFGCGIGRITQALAAHYASCVGLDISEEMDDWAVIMRKTLGEQQSRNVREVLEGRDR
jgi:cyclopropane fatty-acyl-phospholipid synthase-like methyltransferase